MTLVLTPATAGSGTAGGAAITIDVTSYDFSEQSALSLGSQSSGAGAGKATSSPLVVTTAPGAQTAGLFADLGSGGDFATAELVVPSGPSSLDVTFKLVQLQKVEESSAAVPAETPGQGGPAGPVETLSFGYGALAISTGQSSTTTTTTSTTSGSGS